MDTLNAGELVRKARVASGLSQEALAERMRAAGARHWRQTTVSRIENGSQPLSVHDAVLLEVILEGLADAPGGGQGVGALVGEDGSVLGTDSIIGPLKLSAVTTIARADTDELKTVEPDPVTAGLPTLPPPVAESQRSDQASTAEWPPKPSGAAGDSTAAVLEAILQQNALLAQELAVLAQQVHQTQAMLEKHGLVDAPTPQTATPPALPVVPSGQPRELFVTTGPLAGTSIALADAPIQVGRATDNTLVIADRSVSSHHARISQQSGQWILEDLGSTNGTFVNFRRVVGAVPLGLRSAVQIGQTTMELR